MDKTVNGLIIRLNKRIERLLMLGFNQIDYGSHIIDYNP